MELSDNEWTTTFRGTATRTPVMLVLLNSIALVGAYVPEAARVVSPGGRVRVAPRAAMHTAPQCATRRTDKLGMQLGHHSARQPDAQQERETSSDHNKPIAIVGGGVSGIWAALTLVELGYTNITIYEKELRVGGKAAAFEYDGKKYPLGAVGTPLALPEASFTESQLLEKPMRFARSLLRGTARRLEVLNANNLVLDNAWPVPFPEVELTSQAPVKAWQRAFGAAGRPERFYAHELDFSSAAASHLASSQPLGQIVPSWGHPRTSWPLVYVSAHGYGVPEAEKVPPLYYWYRFAQKSTNAGVSPLRLEPWSSFLVRRAAASSRSPYCLSRLVPPTFY